MAARHFSLSLLFLEPNRGEAGNMNDTTALSIFGRIPPSLNPTPFFSSVSVRHMPCFRAWSFNKSLIFVTVALQTPRAKGSLLVLSQSSNFKQLVYRDCGDTDTEPAPSIDVIIRSGFTSSISSLSLPRVMDSGH